MWIRVDIATNERGFVIVDEKPVRYLTPGRWRIPRWMPGRKIRIERHGTDALVAKIGADRAALVPSDEARGVKVTEGERVVVRMRGVPVRWLGPGEHLVWTVERPLTRNGTAAHAAVEFERVDVAEPEVAPLSRELRAVVPAAEYAEVTVPQGAVALRFVDGVLDAVLGPGRHAAWTVVRSVAFAVTEMRERIREVSGQEVMTKDRVSLRLNLSVTYRVEDAQRLATVARDPDDMLHLAVQVAAREAVGSRSLDELLAARDALSGAIAGEVAARAEAVGLRMLSLSLKDFILPGDMKTLLNKVIEAQKEAEANVILRREETAATRSLAQTARVLAENPLLMRLKELEAYAQMAEKVGTVHVVLGSGTLPKLELKA